jgi:LysR family transcriptional regulator, hydrogen peroxide-inducible genes activator
MVDPKCCRYFTVVHLIVRCSHAIDLCTAGRGKIVSRLISFVCERSAIPCHWFNGQERLDITIVTIPSLQQLRFLCALAERRHFGRAAESCAVTQSTLSGGIKELEARLGVPLFERSHRHVMLTPLGKEIATRAQRLLVDAEELVGLARNAHEPLSGPLRFGVIPTVGPYVLPSLLPHLGTELPKLKLYVREAQTAVLLDKLAAGELDLLLAAIPFELGDVETMKIVEDPIVVAMPCNHPLGRHRVVRRDDLAREQLLLIEDGHCLRSHSLQACRIVDPVRNEVFQATSLRTLVQMVAADLGITLMPQIAVDSELASARNVVVRPLSPDKPFRTLVLAWRSTSSRGNEFRLLGNLIRECLTSTKTAFAPDQHAQALFAR